MDRLGTGKEGRMSDFNERRVCYLCGRGAWNHSRCNDCEMDRLHNRGQWLLTGVQHSVARCGPVNVDADGREVPP